MKCTIRIRGAMEASGSLGVIHIYLKIPFSSLFIGSWIGIALVIRLGRQTESFICRPWYMPFLDDLVVVC